MDLRLPWEGALRAAGFAPRERTAWLVEGLLPYLREDDVRRLFERISALSPAGSTLALDVAGPGAFTSPQLAPQLALMKARGIEMHYTCADPVGLLDGFGWTAAELTFGELARRYGRPAEGRATEEMLQAHCVAASRRPG